MILVLLILTLVFGGAIAFLSERFGPSAPRWTAIATLSLNAIFILPFFGTEAQPQQNLWLQEFQAPWIPHLGIGFHLGIDGVSLLLTALTFFLGLIAIMASWAEIQDRVGAFHANMLWTIAGVTGVFLSLDLFLFFVFWEVMIIPMFFLISIWGHEDRQYAAIKFFLFTQISGLLMLVAIVALALLHQAKTGTYTFDYLLLLKTELDRDTALWLMLGFLAAFAVKLPAVPFHTWLPDAHTQAPTGGSILLAGVLLKTGAYGMLRFVIPLFPSAVADLAPSMMTLGAISIIYGGVMAYAQNDLKRLIAYSSISHMGFVMIGLFADNLLAAEGAMMTMLAHGLSATALFMIAGGIQERLHTRDMERLGGLWSNLPRMGAMTLFFSSAALGLPGLANFVGEFMVLGGAFHVNPLIAALGSLGLVIAPVYSLILIQRTFHGEPGPHIGIRDLGIREMTALASLLIATIAMGIYPQPLIDRTEPVISLNTIKPVMAKGAL